MIIDPITEERASRTLYRIELLRRIREQVLPHPLLSERLKLCQPSPDLPEWWECGRHDRDLLLGASKHGVSRTDYHILNDPTLAFLEAHQRFTSQRGASANVGAPGEITKGGMAAADTTSAPLLTPAELASAAAAAKIAVNAAKEEEGEGKTDIEVKMEGEDVNDIPCTKTETPDEQKENEGEVSEGKDEAPTSPRMEIKKEEEAQPNENKEEWEAQEEQQCGEDSKALKTENDQKKDMTEEKSSLSPAGSLSDQKETTTELPEHSSSSPKAQPGHKTTEEDGEERENPESPKSPKSAETEKSPEEEEEERLDEDDKSEKSSQAEGMGDVSICSKRLVVAESLISCLSLTVHLCIIISIVN